MRHQRGFALIVYGLMAAGAVAAIGGLYYAFMHHCNTVCKELMVERDAIAVQAKNAQDRLAEALAANVSCRASIDTLSVKVTAQNQVVDDMATMSEHAIQLAKAAMAKAATSERATRSREATARLTAIAAGPPTRGDFHAQCTAANDILSDVAAERLRDRAAISAPAK